MKLGLGLGLQKDGGLGGGLDPALSAYIATTGATDTAGLANLVYYVRGQGLWHNFVIYPMKAAQSYGSGSTVAPLGALTSNVMTLVNGPTWGASGIRFRPASSQYGHVSTGPLTIAVVSNITPAAFGDLEARALCVVNTDLTLSQRETITDLINAL